MNLFFTILSAVIVGNIISEFLLMWLFGDPDDSNNNTDHWGD